MGFTFYNHASLGSLFLLRGASLQLTSVVTNAQDCFCHTLGVNRHVRPSSQNSTGKSGYAGSFRCVWEGDLSLTLYWGRLLAETGIDGRVLEAPDGAGARMFDAAPFTFLFYFETMLKVSAG